MTKDLVWVIGGGLIQLLMIQEVKRRGYRVLVTDQDPLCQGALIADEFVQLDTYDIEAHLAYAQRMAEQPCAVLTYGADVGPTVSRVAAHFGLPAAKLASALAARNKGVMRMSLRAGMNLRTPAYWLVEARIRGGASYASWVNDCRKEWQQAAKSEHVPMYPCVVKPTENCASRGFSVVRGDDDWGIALDLASQHNRQARCIIIEEYVPGREFATDWFVAPGRAEVLYVMGVERHFLQPGIEFGCTYPLLEQELLAEMQKLARRAAVCLDIEGPFKVDFTVSPSYGLLIGECATRQSGGFDQYIYPMVKGIDAVGFMLDYSLGQKLDRDKLRPKMAGGGAHVAPVYNPGRIEGWTNIEEVKHRPEVCGVFVRALDRIGPLVDGAARPLFVAARGETPEQAFVNACVAGARIQPIYASNQGY